MKKKKKRTTVLRQNLRPMTHRWWSDQVKNMPSKFSFEEKKRKGVQKICDSTTHVYWSAPFILVQKFPKKKIKTKGPNIRLFYKVWLTSNNCWWGRFMRATVDGRKKTIVMRQCEREEKGSIARKGCSERKWTENWFFYGCRFIVGRRLAIRSSFVPTTSAGRRLTRYAPVRMLWVWTAEIPVRLLRMLPESLAVSFLNRGGGANSNVVYIPDFRMAWLDKIVRFFEHSRAWKEKEKGSIHLRAWNGSKIIERWYQRGMGTSRRCVWAYSSIRTVRSTFLSLLERLSRGIVNWHYRHVIFD